jgi:type VI secretion system protein ImpI
VTLVLSVLRCPDAVPPEIREVKGGEFSIGRGPENNWVLADPDRHLSKRHCVLAFRAGGWQLADTSTNGTFLNRESEAVGPGRPRSLRDGDRLHLGAYEIEVRLADEAAAPIAARSSHDADPFGDDPFRPPPAPFAAEPPLGHVTAPDQVRLPSDFDPLGPEPGEDGLGAPIQSDHTPGMEDAFRPPSPGGSMLPDDWDLEMPAAAPAPSRLSPSAPPPFRSPPQPAPEPPRPPAQRAPRPAAPAPPSPPVQVELDPFDEPLIAPAPAPTPTVPSPPRPSPAPVAQPIAAKGFDELETAAPSLRTLPPVPVAPVAAQPAAEPADVSLLSSFLRGAGLADAKLGDPAATFEELGRAFRVLVAELRAALIARAAIKGEFRIEQTMIRSSGNNPLKFSAGDDDALAALLGSGRRVDVKPSAAIADALRDLRLHELATMSAMQSAVRALLGEFDPTALRREAEQGGMAALVPVQRKARAWDAFEKLHARIGQALADDFDSVFGKAFARAYEEALNDARGREDPKS